MVKELENCTIPKHIAFIMDGNGRWAKEKGKSRTYGHNEGSNTLKEVCKNAFHYGVKFVTVFAFSTENWIRPDEEISFLMDLLRKFLKESIKTSKKDNMRVRVFGDRSRLPQDINERIEELENASKNNTGLNLQIALNYGGRNDIVRAAKKIINDVSMGKVNTDEIDENLFSKYLDTYDIPDPDLLIRTSGEMRISNFLLWQLAYTELYFPNKYWPDFNKADLLEAIIVFNKKERRFGGLVHED